MRKLSIEDCRRVAADREGICLSLVYESAKQHILWQCKYKHKPWKSTFDKIKNAGRWCPTCSKNAKLSIDDCHSLAASKEGFCLSIIYKNSSSMLTWQCKYRHKPWMTTYNSINSNKTWCPVCSNKPHLSIEDCHLTAKERRGVCLSSVYLDMESRHLPGSANTATSRGKQHITVYAIKIVGVRIVHIEDPEAESEIYDFIKNIYPDSLSGVKKLLSSKGFELDIFIPSLKVAIEYDGR